jgi:hypothetical protein
MCSYSPAQIGVSASRRPPIPLPDPPVRACWQRRCVLPEHRPAWAPQPVAFCSAARIVACSSRLAASAEFLSWAAAGSSACCFAAAVRFCAASAAAPFRSSAAVRTPRLHALSLRARLSGPRSPCRAWPSARRQPALGSGSPSRRAGPHGAAHHCAKELSQRLTTSRALFDTEMFVSLIPRVVGRRTLGSV